MYFLFCSLFTERNILIEPKQSCIWMVQTLEQFSFAENFCQYKILVWHCFQVLCSHSRTPQTWQPQYNGIGIETTCTKLPIAYAEDGFCF